MIQIIGIVEVLIFYLAYFLKLFKQKGRGIKTNQFGGGNKSAKTVIIESILRFSSAIIAGVIFASAVLNTSLISSPIWRGIGLILFSSGTLLFIMAMITMKDSWRAGIPDEDKTSMVSSGIYKISRNSAFLGFDLTYIGSCITFGNKYLVYKNKVGRYFIFI